MNLPHKVLELDIEFFKENANQIFDKIKCNVTSHIENCIGFYYIGRFARANGFRTVLTANGCDELFCGYDRFRLAYTQGSQEPWLTDKKLKMSLYHARNRLHIKRIGGQFITTVPHT